MFLTDQLLWANVQGDHALPRATKGPQLRTFVDAEWNQKPPEDPRAPPSAGVELGSNGRFPGGHQIGQGSGGPPFGYMWIQLCWMTASCYTQDLWSVAA
ncbi:hypothetical protein GE21DRAFT_3104 [Neurospora crassa]|uniref:Uncharacterized protein n=1 Tax=Neurospora crassa (strain ATCC 24698 / 74-OR23-1A / CBS 708.71 / DSM 1257 / FGSC 987) TaxID=367110 RepID=Q7SCH7_NEUCR|nr:hypothetical protein NCU06784 [Neurospora crassa OR74A]EAA34389.1 hypothetical protein NCU06784 [Neurospora crassa OR74A]KHE87651.1 hypothetical protein GE21DRAFT_3104 [Neurospora crassa]|eukprot:XP_963625.1 hypothetical protein NCU06784 [Neurospora crassa OR74A]